MYGRDAAPLYRRYATLTEDALADANALDQELAAALVALKEELDEACGALAAVYLPELTAEALADAEKRTGFRAFSQRKPLDVMAREAAKLTTRIAGMERDERWEKREALVGPHGRWTRELAEAKDLLDPWERECKRFEDLDGFLELVGIGYDTPQFQERWWQPQYWRHWQQGDRICAALGMDDFGDDVLPAYQKALEPRTQWRGEVRRIEENMRQVHDHVRAHDEAVWRRDHLAEIYLEECRGRLAEHLHHVDEGLLATWAEGDRGVLVLLKRVSGLSAKLQMLEEMRSKWLGPTRRDLDAARAKMHLKANKLGRPKKARLQVNVPAGLEQKLQAQAARRQKARQVVHRIVRWDGYDRFDLAQPPETWWIHIHEGRRPGVFTPTLRTWYDRRPDLAVVVDPDWEAHRGEPLVAHHVHADTGDIS